MTHTQQPVPVIYDFTVYRNIRKQKGKKISIVSPELFNANARMKGKENFLRKNYRYSILERFRVFWTLMLMVLVTCFFAILNGKGFKVIAGIKRFFYLVLFFGIVDGILRIKGTPRNVSVDEESLKINGWLGRTQIALSEIQLVEWDKGGKIWFSLFYDRFRIQCISRRTIVLNGSFKEGSKNFAENLQSMGIKLVEKPGDRGAVKKPAQ